MMLGPPFWKRVIPKPLPKTFVPKAGGRFYHKQFWEILAFMRVGLW